MDADELVSAWAPGRVNLIGEHTDYTGGLAMPMAIQLGTTVQGRLTENSFVELFSEQLGTSVRVPLDITDPETIEPRWGRYVAGVVAELHPARGLVGTVASDLPIGAGLSSSASLEVAVALALGADADPRSLAELCQRAEQSASGVPCGILDQLAVTAGIEDHALVMDCHDLTWRPVPVPEAAGFTVVHSGQERELAGSAYAERRRQCEAAEAIVGPLRSAALPDLEAMDDDLLRRRARHVVTENARVREFAARLHEGDLPAAGDVMIQSHQSLRDDFDVSTPVLDELVDHLRGIPGVHGARLTGAGFGGCVVVLADPEADLGVEGWHVRPGPSAHRLA